MGTFFSSARGGGGASSSQCFLNANGCSYSENMDLSDDTVRSSASSSKLVVRNLPFQVNHSEVKELFSSLGQLKALRLPRKFDGSHRGFAFVEFGSKAEAASAMASLSATHMCAART